MLPQSTSKEIILLNQDLGSTPYILDYHIGTGSFGKVFHGINLKKKRDFAIKVFSKIEYKNNHHNLIYDEINIISNLKNENIIKFYDMAETTSHIFLIMEFLKGGNLRELIEKRRKNNNPFTNEELRLIMKGIVNAVQYLHQNDIVHRDIKSENILIENEENLDRVKLIDFGLSVKFTDVNKSLYVTCGTPLYVAPELYKYKVYSKPVDIWSCGLILYELLTLGKHPFYHREMMKQEFFKILENPIFEIPEEFPPMARDLLKKMIAVEPSERYTAERICLHPFVTGEEICNIPLSSLESMQAFQNQEKLSTICKVILFALHIKKVGIQHPKKLEGFIKKTDKNLYIHAKSLSPKKVLKPFHCSHKTFKSIKSKFSDTASNFIKTDSQPDSPTSPCSFKTSKTSNFSNMDSKNHKNLNLNLQVLPLITLKKTDSHHSVRFKPSSISLLPSNSSLNNNNKTSKKMKNDSTNEGIGKTSAAKSFDLPNYLVSEPTHINIGRKKFFIKKSMSSVRTNDDSFQKETKYNEMITDFESSKTLDLSVSKKFRVVSLKKK